MTSPPASTRLCWRASTAALVLFALAACGPGGPVDGERVIEPGPVEASPGTIAAADAPDPATASDGGAAAAPAAPPDEPLPDAQADAAEASGGSGAAAPGADPDTAAVTGGPTEDAAPADANVQPTAASPPPLDGPLGSLCRTYLRPDVPHLIIEVDAQDGAQLPQAVLDHLTATLGAVLDKPGGIVLDTSGVIDGGAQPWTLQSILATAAGSRSHMPTADTTVMHLLSLRGEPDQAPPASGQPDIRTSIGVAFAAGEMVVFPDRVEGLAALLGGATAVLRSVTVHEAGHLLCLINLGYTSAIDHEDPDHPGHSADQGSVMYHAIETTAIGQLFSGPPPDRFSADDLADLEGLRTGRY